MGRRRHHLPCRPVPPLYAQRPHVARPSGCGVRGAPCRCAAVLSRSLAHWDTQCRRVPATTCLEFRPRRRCRPPTFRLCTWRFFSFSAGIALFVSFVTFLRTAASDTRGVCTTQSPCFKACAKRCQSLSKAKTRLWKQRRRPTSASHRFLRSCARGRPLHCPGVFLCVVYVFGLVFAVLDCAQPTVVSRCSVGAVSPSHPRRRGVTGLNSSPLKWTTRLRVQDCLGMAAPQQGQAWEQEREQVQGLALVGDHTSHTLNVLNCP